jgi:hypothetical protein
MTAVMCSNGEMKQLWKYGENDEMQKEKYQ